MALLGWALAKHFAAGATASDTTPDAFTFTDSTSANLAETVTSNTITVTGIDSAATVTFTEGGHLSGEYSKNGGTWTDLANTTVENNDTLAIRLTSSVSTGTAVTIAVTIGGVADSDTPWTVTTKTVFTSSEGAQAGNRVRTGGRNFQRRTGSKTGNMRSGSRHGRKKP